MDNKKIGKLISERRKGLGLTQQQLAEQLGVCNKTISKWETGEGFPDIETIPKLCKALNVTPNEFFSNGKTLQKPNEFFSNGETLQNSEDCIKVDLLVGASKSGILVVDRRYDGSRIEVIKLLEGFYLVIRVNIELYHRDKDSDIWMLTGLRQFAEKNQIDVILTDVLRYGFSTWTVLRKAAIDCGFRALGDKQRGIVYTGSSYRNLKMTQVELKAKILEIHNERKELDLSFEEYLFHQ